MTWFVCIGGAFFLWAIFTFNGLVTLRNQATNALAGVEVNLKKRHDLIPNIVQTVKGYVRHEQQLLERLTELRSAAVQQAAGRATRFATEEQISCVLGEIQVLVEGYPDLKVSEQFMFLQRAMTEIEEQLSAARRAYNASVMNLENARQMFPSMIIAGCMQFPHQSYFEATPAERKNVSARIS